MTSLNHLKAMQALDAALRTGSLTSAARELGITPAAVGQRIKALEDFAGYPLLSRGSSGLVPTPALREAAADLARGFQHLSDAAERLGLENGRTVTVMADADWAGLWLAPRLASFQAQHPFIVLNICHETSAGPARTRIDFNVTYRQIDSSAELLFRDYLVPVCSPENARRILSLPEDSRLEGFPLLHLEYYAADPEALTWPAWVDRFGYRRTDASRGVRYRQISQGLDAVRSDAGVLLCGLALVMAGLAKGSLAAPFGTAKGRLTGYGYVLSTRSAALTRPACRRFMSWLQQEAAKTGAALEEATAGQG